jgi:hypothetical protein
VFTLAVVTVTLAGFVLASEAGVNSAWAALAGAAVLTGRALAQHRTTPAGLGLAADVPFLVFVLGLGIVVKPVVDSGLGRALGPLLPAGTSLPGTAVPDEPAPTLTPLNLDLAGAARGQLGGVAGTTFAYRTPSGARLTIVRSSQPFPEASEARQLGRTEDAWTARSSGVTIICAQGTHTMLLLGSDATLVRQAGALLNVI